MGRLYREATADLARLQTFQQQGALPDELVDYLNHLVARAHGLNAGLLPLSVDNTDIYRILYATLFGVWLP